MGRVHTNPPGVLMQYTPGSGYVIFVGRADALIAAGLVQEHQLPGHHGNPRTSTTFDSRGERMRSGKCRGHGNHPGKKSILARQLDGRPMYHVTEWLTDERAAELRDAEDAARAREEQELERLARSWPFPVSSRGYSEGAGMTRHPAGHDHEVHV